MVENIAGLHRAARDFLANTLLPVTAILGGCAAAPLTAEQTRTAPSEVQATSPAARPPEDVVLSGAGTELDPAIPTPESILGHPLGGDAVRYEPMVRYLRALADSSPSVTLTPYATSHEGRRLYYLTITRQENHARLEQIKTANARLADPRTLENDEEAEKILDMLPAVAWLGYAIHGDELSSTDAALQVAYQLVAGTDENTKQLRRELVIHIDPLMNPDGRERYLGQLEHLKGKMVNPDYQAMQHSGLWSAGRGNHYLFDLNRDWLMQTQPETRGRAAIIQQWNPHLVVDSHEMGALDTYLFDPPREPINVHLSDTTMSWRRRFSAEQAKAFDRYGWSYYTGEWYEEWYPGYTNAWAALQGAIGILYEQAGVNAAAVKQATGEVLTYRQAVAHHVVSSFANLRTLREHRGQILRDFLSDRRWAVSPRLSGAEVFLLPPVGDGARFRRFVDLLRRQGIEFAAAGGAFEASDLVDIRGRRLSGATFPPDTLIVRAAQPRRRLVQAMLDFDAHMSRSFLQKEREDLENHRGTRLYDVTAWSLPLAYGLEAYRASTVSELPALRPASQKEGTPSAPNHPAGYGYLIDGRSSDIHRAIVRLLEAKCQVRVGTEPFSVGGLRFRRGTVLLRNHENPPQAAQLIERAIRDLDVDVHATDTALSHDGPDLGGPRYALVTAPRIAIASQWPAATTSFGAVWHLLDERTGLRVSPVNVQSLGRIDLRKYNVLVLPDTRWTEALTGVLDSAVLEKLRRWVEAGGTLVAIGGSAAFLADEERGLSAVRLRRNVLDQLAVYDEAVTREKRALNVRVDPETVWGPARTGTDWSPSEGGDPEPPASTAAIGPAAGAHVGDGQAPGDLDALKRNDEWMRLFSPHGAIVSATLKPEHWICFGALSDGANGNALPLLLKGSYALMSKHPVQTPGRLSDADSLRLSGLLWPEARQRWADTAYVTVERVGYGQVILFVADPFFRAYFEGTGRLLLNALILGPGLGTAPAIPW